jgi:hypothetical protein
MLCGATAGPGEESESEEEDSEAEEERRSNAGGGRGGGGAGVGASEQTQGIKQEENVLRRGLVKDVDYTLFPSSVFRHIYSWCVCHDLCFCSAVAYVRA